VTVLEGLGERADRLSFETDGYAILKGVVSPSGIAEITQGIHGVLHDSTRLAYRIGVVERYARVVLDALAPCVDVRDFTAISCHFFSKHEDRNWIVPPHRDEYFLFKRQMSDEIATDWCSKEGAWFAKPNRPSLRSIVAARLALDRNHEGNGPLRLVPRSHVSESASDEIQILLDPGDVLLMSPLCLHASGKSSSADQRRVLHYAYGPTKIFA
jgi:hypothetical protein